MKSTKFKNKTEKGITLIALIITIVVLMILAAVAISSITNEGILNHANNAVIGYEQEKVKENTTLDNYEWVVDKWANGLANKEFKAAYKIGNTVTLKDKNGNTHNFYVIANSDASQPKVTLMAEKCINPDTFLQTDSGYEVPFSSDDYWADDESVWEDLNNLTVPDDVTSVVTIAKEYGEELFGITTGRLLTKSEADKLVPVEGADDYDEKYAMVFGDLYYWLGSANNIYQSDVWSVYGDYGIVDGSFADGGGYDNYYDYGVRPVITISKTSEYIVSVEE